MALIKNNQISVVQPFDMSDQRVINVGYPITGSDATTKFYVDQHIWDSGSGDMYKSVYDINDVGYVDSASYSFYAPTNIGVISSSIQIDHNSTTNFVSNQHFLQSEITEVGTVLSGDVSSIIIGDTVLSSSYSVTSSYALNVVAQTWAAITGIPVGIISGSSQVDYNNIQNQPTLVNSASYSITASFAKNVTSPTWDTISGKPTVISGSSQTDHNLTTNYVSNQHFLQSAITEVGTVTSGDVSFIITGDTVLSSSFSITSSYSPTNVGVISSSIQINHDTTTNYASNQHFLQSAITEVGTVTSGNILSILPSGVISGSLIDSSSYAPTNPGIVSESFQITFLEISSIPVGIVSSSTQVDYTLLQNIPSEIVSSSTQIDYTQIQNQPILIDSSSYSDFSLTSSFALNVDSSWNSLTDVPSGIVSSSTQIDYTLLQNIPSGIFSGSHGDMIGLGDDDHTQYYNSTRLNTWVSASLLPSASYAVTSSYTTDPNLAYKNKINSFTEDQYITGSLIVSGVLDMSNTYIHKVGYIDFDLDNGYGHAEGRLHWDDADKTLEIGTEVTGTHIQIGQEQVVRCTNTSGATITNGSVVYITGAQGHRPTIGLARADSIITSGGTLGLATHDISNNNTGYVTTFGMVREINTYGFIEGLPLWLSCTTAGTMTQTRPPAPNLGVVVATCLYSHATEGIVAVNTNVIARLASLPDVNARGNQGQGDILYWNNSGSYWDAVNTSSISVATSSIVTDPTIAYINKTNQFSATQNITGSLLLSGSYSTSSGLLFGDGDTGIYEGYNNQLWGVVGGDIRLRLTSTYLDLHYNQGPRLNYVLPSSTVPTLLPTGEDTDTGIGWAGPNTGSLIAGGVNVLNWHQGTISLYTENPTASFDVGGDIQAIFFTASWAPSEPGTYDETQPVYTFAGDYNTGIAHGNDGQISFVGNGVELASFTGVAGVPFYEFSAMSGSGNRLVYADSSGYIFAGSTYVNIFSSSEQVDHGLIQGLTDDDHVQYYNVERLNAYISASPVPNAYNSVSSSYSSDVDRSLLMERATTASYALDVDRSLVMNTAISASFAETSNLSHVSTTASYALNAKEIGGVDFAYIAITTESNTFTQVQQYSSNNYALFVNRSIVDKEYVDDAIAEIYNPTGSNPLTSSYSLYSETASYMDPLRAGNDVSDVHMITGSLYISGSLILNAGGSNDYIGIGDDITDLIWITGSVHHTGSYEMDGLIKYTQEFHDVYDDRTLVDVAYVTAVIDDIQSPTGSTQFTASYAIYSETSSYMDPLRAGNHASDVHMITGSLYISGSLIISQDGPTIIGDDYEDQIYFSGSITHTGSYQMEGLIKYRDEYYSLFDDRTLVDKGWVDSITGSLEDIITGSVSASSYWDQTGSNIYPIDPSYNVVIGSDYASASLHVWESQISGSVLPSNTSVLIEDQSTYLTLRGKNTSAWPAGILLGSVNEITRTSFWGLNVLNEDNGNSFGLTHGTHTIDGNGPGTLHIIVDTSGHVGIGTSITTGSVSDSRLTVRTENAATGAYLYTAKDNNDNILFSVNDGGDGYFAGNLNVDGNLTANQFIVSSSVTYMTQSFSSGSTMFGDSIDDTHIFTGSLYITGSQRLEGDLQVIGDIRLGITSEEDGTREISTGGNLILHAAKESTDGLYQTLGLYAGSSTVAGNMQFSLFGGDTQVVLIDSDGLGIYKSPEYSLDVSGSTRFGTIDTENHWFTGSVNISGSIISDIYYIDNNNIYIDTTGSSDMTFTSTDVGTITLDQLRKPTTFNYGTFYEHFDAYITSNGTNISLNLQSVDNGDLTMHFSTGDYTLDCTPTASVGLTAGSVSIPQENFTYVPISTKVLTNSTGGWPATEHIKVAYSFVQTAIYVQSDGALVNQNWNDGLQESNNMGHLTQMGRWIREQGATYFSGIDPEGAGGTYVTTAASSVTVQIGSGILSQLHKHTYSSKDTSAGDDMHIVNAGATDGGAYFETSNLFNITVDATDTAITVGSKFNIVLIGVANKSGQYSPLLVNVPNGSYNTLADAESDVSGYDVYNVPREFVNESSTAFLIARLTFTMGVTDWTYESYVDLRGTKPTSVAGTTTAGDVLFNDALFRIFNNIDSSKEIAFDAQYITTLTTRTITMDDRDVDLRYIAYTNESNHFTGSQYFSGSLVVSGGVDLDGGLIINRVDVSAETYTSSENDYYLGITRTSTGTCIVSLGDASLADGRELKIKDEGGNAFVNNITIMPENSPSLIDGTGSYVMNNNYEAVVIISDGTDWFVN